MLHDLHSLWADDVKGSGHALNKLNDFGEALISNTPGAVDEEDQVGLGTFTHCGTNTQEKKSCCFFYLKPKLIIVGRQIVTKSTHHPEQGGQWLEQEEWGAQWASLWA